MVAAALQINDEKMKATGQGYYWLVLTTLSPTYMIVQKSGHIQEKYTCGKLLTRQTLKQIIVENLKH